MVKEKNLYKYSGSEQYWVMFIPIKQEEKKVFILIVQQRGYVFELYDWFPETCRLISRAQEINRV